MNTNKSLIAISLFTILILFASVSFGCLNIQDKPGNGKYVKEDRVVGSFSKLDIGGAFQVYLTQGDRESLTVEADESEIGDIISEVVSGKLKIYMKPGWRGRYHEVSVYVTFRNLDDIDFSGAVEVTNTNQLKFKDLRMDVSGAAEIEMDFIADKFSAEFTGASEVEFRGKCMNGNIEISGASEFDAEGLEFQDLEIEISGAGEAKVFVTGNLNVDASGAASIRHKGGAKVSSKVSGAASVKTM